MKGKAFLATLMGVALVVGAMLSLGAPVADASSRATLTVGTISRSGITLSATSAATLGHKLTNDGNTFVEVINGYTATITATFITPRTIDGLAIDDLSVAVAAGATTFVGPFPVGTFNQNDGTSEHSMLYIDYSDETTVTVAAFSLP